MSGNSSNDSGTEGSSADSKSNIDTTSPADNGDYSDTDAPVPYDMLYVHGWGMWVGWGSLAMLQLISVRYLRIFSVFDAIQLK